MAVICLASLAGAPGVSTTALGLALCWPRSVLLADCDKHPNQTVLAGHLRGISAGRRGLGELALAYREQRLADAALVNQVLPLSAEADRQVNFLPGFTHPRAAQLFELWWPNLAEQFQSASANNHDVLIDLGRLDADGIPEPLLAISHLVLLVTGTRLPQLAAVRLGLPGLRNQVGGVSAGLQLVTIGAGRPYPAGEVAALLELELAQDLPWQPADAAVLSDGMEWPRRFTERPWWRSLRTLSAKLASQLLVSGAVVRDE